MFDDVTALSSTYQVFCKILFIFSLPDFFSCVKSGIIGLGQEEDRCKVLFSSHYTEGTYYQYH